MPTTTTIYFLGTNTQDNTATFAINGQRWEYWLPNPASVESVNYIASHWIKRGLAFAPTVEPLVRFAAGRE